MMLTKRIHAAGDRLQYQVYLLQLENYDLRRFLGLWREHLRGPLGPKRNPIVWTQKLMLVTSLATLFVVLDVIFLQQLFSALPFLLQAVLSIGAIVLAGVCFFVYLAVATFVLIPVDRYMKSRIVAAAQARVRGRKAPLTVIGITGSYGKTSMKSAIVSVLQEKYNVLSTPENINTPIGIARMLLEQLTDDVDVLVVEMGAYHQGDIAELCVITPPTIAVLTGINEAHLERFGSLQATTNAKFEIVDHARPDALVVLNADDERVMAYAQEHTKGRQTYLYSSHNAEGAMLRSEAVVFDQNRPGLTFTLSGPNGRVGEFAMPHLSTYVIGLVSAAVMIGQHLALSQDEIRRGVAGIVPPPHRLQVGSTEGDIIIIDDSYNGNPKGVAEAVAALKAFEGRRRIYVTPGLVEMGSATEHVHEEIGRQLASAADVVVLITNSATPSIAKGLTEAGFDEQHIKWFDSGPAAYAAVPNMTKAGDVVLFQNDWPENYT